MEKVETLTETLNVINLGLSTQTNPSGEVTEEVKVSLQETLLLETWSDRVRYGALKEILGPSTSLHLQQNLFVREIFGLGPPPLKIEKRGKVEKHEIVSIIFILN